MCKIKRIKKINATTPWFFKKLLPVKVYVTNGLIKFNPAIDKPKAILYILLSVIAYRVIIYTSCHGCIMVYLITLNTLRKNETIRIKIDRKIDTAKSDDLYY